MNVILNQTVIQQQQPTVQTTTTTAAGNQQQMVAININGTQTLIPLSMFTKLLQQKNATAQQPTTNVNQFSFHRLGKYNSCLFRIRQYRISILRLHHQQFYRMVQVKIVNFSLRHWTKNVRWFYSSEWIHSATESITSTNHSSIRSSTNDDDDSNDSFFKV